MTWRAAAEPLVHLVLGLQPDARYAARDVHIGSGARECTPLQVLPLTAGFGAERVGQRDVQSTLYVFD